MAKEIQELEDIKLMVDSFYGKVREDDMLGSIFERVVQGNWPTHLEKMYSFWETILLDERTYTGQPFIVHLKLDIDAAHFERWLQLFYKTVDEHFEGSKAEEAKTRAYRIAQTLHHKVTSFKNNDNKFIQ